MRVTPTQAREWLRHRIGQTTKLDCRTIIALAERIERGEFTPDPPIRFTEDGALHDGRHRLLAILLVGRPIEVTVEGD